MEKLQKTTEIISGIVTYNPNCKDLKKNIDSILQQPLIKKIIIVDNGSNNIEEVKKISTSKEFILIENKENSGIAFALNQIMKEAYQLGFEWVLTCDQDSRLPNNMLFEFSKYTNLKNVAIISPAIFDVNSNSMLDKVNLDEEVSYIDQCITSGSLNNTFFWESIGGFDEFLFIDSVDFDYCFRLRKHGQKILRVNNMILEHELGDTKNVNIFGKVFPVLNHGPIRKYYIARNRIYCDYKNENGLRVNSILYIIKSIVFILLYEKQKLLKLKKTLSGTIDGFKYGRKIVRNQIDE